MPSYQSFYCYSSTVPCTKWWHNDVFSDTTQPSIAKGTPVPLTSNWTPMTFCDTRWKLLRTVTLSVHLFDSTDRITALQTQTYDFVAYSTIARSSTTRISLDANVYQYDDMESSCQPSSYQRYYSPGVCPDKHTIAEMTAWKSTVGTDGSFETHYLASCCRSGMSFTAIADYGTVSCVGAISSPFRVLQPYTLTSIWTAPLETNRVSSSLFIFWQSMQSLTGPNGKVSTSIIENATTITRGVVMADPILVGWWEKELALFPTSYASSVARQAGIKWGSSTPAPASSSSLPRETGSVRSPPSQVISTDAKIGIAIGIVSATVMGALLLWFFLKRKRRQQRPRTAEIEGKPTPEMEDQDQELATRRWFLRGRWRSEVRTHEAPGELDSRTVNVVPGPPVEMDATERRHHPET